MYNNSDKSSKDTEITEIPSTGKFCSQGAVDVSKLAKYIHEFQGVLSNDATLPGSKVILVGDQNVGKTSIFLRATRNQFSEMYKPTIGLDFSVKKFNIFGLPFAMQVWDTAGQERFRALSKSYQRGASCCICVFDLNRENGLQNVRRWIEDVKTNCEDSQLKVFLVGSKSDLYRAVEVQQIEQLAQELKAEYFEVSAKYNQHVQQLFERIAFLCFEMQLKKWSAMQHAILNNIEISDEPIKMKPSQETPQTETKKRTCCT